MYVYVSCNECHLSLNTHGFFAIDVGALTFVWIVTFNSSYRFGVLRSCLFYYQIYLDTCFLIPFAAGDPTQPFLDGEIFDTMERSIHAFYSFVVLYVDSGVL